MKNFGLVSAVAILGVICIFQVNSAFADAHSLNTFFKVFGGLLIAVSVGIIVYKYANQDNTPEQ